MSSSAAALPAVTSQPSSLLRSLSNLGLGYAIAIALGLLVLLSTLLLTSYVCCRTSSRRRRTSSSDADSLGGVVLPRIIFVAEDDEEEGRSNTVLATGLDPIVFSSYPKFQFSASAEKAKGEGDGTCAICLCEYREAEMLRMLPDCGHSFHLMCIDAWLRLNASCPVCRNSPMPTPQSTPLSTPLSELVPLSQFAGDRRRR